MSELLVILFSFISMQYNVIRHNKLRHKCTLLRSIKHSCSVRLNEIKIVKNRDFLLKDKMVSNVRNNYP